MISTTDLITNTSDRFFIDSNVLVYMCDGSDPQKQPFAEELIVSLVGNRNGALSCQVLGEFFSIVTRRIPRPLTVEEAMEVIDRVGSLDVVEIDSAMVMRAIATHSRYGTTYWGLPNNRRSRKGGLHSHPFRGLQLRPVLPRHTRCQSLLGLKSGPKIWA